jgi:hypothetical protein
MSVSPSIAAIRKYKRPPLRMVPSRLSDRIPGSTGKDSDRLYRMGEGSFLEGMIADALRLQLVPDKPGHGTIQPSEEMAFDEYRNELRSTRPMWRDGEGDPDE